MGDVEPQVSRREPRRCGPWWGSGAWGVGIAAYYTLLLLLLLL